MQERTMRGPCQKGLRKKLQLQKLFQILLWKIKYWPHMKNIRSIILEKLQYYFCWYYFLIIVWKIVNISPFLKKCCQWFFKNLLITEEVFILEGVCEGLTDCLSAVFTAASLTPRVDLLDFLAVYMQASPMSIILILGPQLAKLWPWEC